MVGWLVFGLFVISTRSIGYLIRSKEDPILSIDDLDFPRLRKFMDLGMPTA